MARIKTAVPEKCNDIGLQHRFFLLFLMFFFWRSKDIFSRHLPTGYVDPFYFAKMCTDVGIEVIVAFNSEFQYILHYNGHGVH